MLPIMPNLPSGLGARLGGGAGHLASASIGFDVRWRVAVYAISVFACRQTVPWLSVVLLRCWRKQCHLATPQLGGRLRSAVVSPTKKKSVCCVLLFYSLVGPPIIS